jgi:hypothetical protein
VSLFRRNGTDSDDNELLRCIAAVKRRIEEDEAVETEMAKAETAIVDAWATIERKKRECTGHVPLGPYYDICEALSVDPCARFPEGLASAEQKNRSAEASLEGIRGRWRSDVQRLRRRMQLLQEAVRCAKASQDTIDFELYRVIDRYAVSDVDITLDQAIGVALAEVYRREGSSSELRRIATSGRFALKEVGNCAADVVFDPDARSAMASRHRQLGRWSRHQVMMEYMHVASDSLDHSTINAYNLRADRLAYLPEHVLHGLVVCGESHVMRILDVENDGIIVADGNIDGDLRFGHLVPYHEVQWGENNLIVYAREPDDLHGLHPALTPYEYTNPEKVGYESLQESLDDLSSACHIGIASPEQLLRLPQEVRDSLSVVYLRQGAMYDITHYADLVDEARTLFPQSSPTQIIEAFISAARSNPSGEIVAITITSENAGESFPSHCGRESGGTDVHVL